MDVYKLKDTFVNSETGSDGWRFLDQQGNVVFVGGDVKIIRMDEKKLNLWDKYKEYHMEFESQSYRQKFNSFE